jgi:hypothetical protein
MEHLHFGGTLKAKIVEKRSVGEKKRRSRNVGLWAPYDITYRTPAALVVITKLMVFP